MEQGHVLPIVVGAHLRAELHDRPAAYALRDAFGAAIQRRPGWTGPLPLVCCDLWYLNQPELRARPTVSVGGPEVNALTALVTPRLPAAFVVEGRYMVQFDPDDDGVACCWGVDGPSTSAAVVAFIDRYLDGFVESAGRP